MARATRYLAAEAGSWQFLDVGTGLVAAYWRTDLTLRQIGPLFGVSYSAVYRVVDMICPLLALAPARRRPLEQVTIVDSTLIPTRDQTLAAPSKNYRHSTILQVAIDADTRLIIALGDPQPGNRGRHERRPDQRD